MGNWIPGDPTLVAQILRISAAYSPPPPDGFVSPMTWGMEDDVIERFATAGVPGDHISFKRATYRFTYRRNTFGAPRPVSAYYGPTMNAFEAATADGREAELQDELEALFDCTERQSEERGHFNPSHVSARHRREVMGIPQGLAPITYGSSVHSSTQLEVAMSVEQRIRDAEESLFDRYDLMADESFVSLLSPKIRLRILSIGSGPDLVLLHGVSLAAAMWAPLLDELTGYRAHLVELPGHGLSDPARYRAGSVRGHSMRLLDELF